MAKSEGRSSTRGMADAALGKWHSCLKMGRAFRACPLMSAGVESSLRPGVESERDTEDDAPRDRPTRPQESISQPGLDQALVRLLDGFRNVEGVPLSPGIPAPGGAGVRTPKTRPGGILEGLPPGIRDLVDPVLAGAGAPVRAGSGASVINGSFVEELWRSLILDQVELTSANTGVLLGPLEDSLRGSSESMASITAMRIAESFIGKLLNAGFNPSGGASPSPVSSTSTSSSPNNRVKQVAGASVAGAAAVGAGILHKTRGGGGGRGVSSPSPRGAGGKFFEAGKKFPILQPR